jgi:hypothetical protein
MRFPSFVILNETECSEDELLRTLSEKFECIKLMYTDPSLSLRMTIK